MTIDSKALRQTLGSFATGITVVTARDLEGNFIGVTINSFSSVSLSPPLVLFSLEKRSSQLETFQKSKSFAINILSDKQEPLSSTFSGDSNNKFLGVETYRLQTGSPLIKGCLGVLDCKTTHEYDGGDHIILIGEVTAFQSFKGNPLLFYGGQYRTLEPETN